MGAYLWVLELINDVTKKVPSLVNLLAFIVFNDLVGVENCNY